MNVVDESMGSCDPALVPVYLDELTLAGLLAARRETQRRGQCVVHVLEALPGGPRGRCLRAVARMLGVEIAPTRFFAGHVRAGREEVAYLAALRRSIPAAHGAARRAIDASPLLHELSEVWGRAPIEIRIARALWWPTMESLLRIEAARALAHAVGGEASVILRRTAVTADCLEDRDGLVLRWYAGPKARESLVHRLLALWWLRQRMMGVRFKIQAGLGQVRPELGRTPGTPSVLIPQEEESSEDWSYRTQPSWLFAGSDAIRVVRIASSVFPAPPSDRNASTPTFVSTGEFHALRGEPRLTSVLRSTLRRVAAAALVARSDSLPALAAVGRLLYFADRMAAVSRAATVKVFVCSENAMIYADAMQMVAQDSGVRTVSFQYSNMAQVAPVMKTAQSCMLTFAPLYHDRLRWPAWNGRIVDVGYPFDYAFARLRERAELHRKDLASRGAQFVLAYFDESVQSDRWGLISESDHERELGRLLDSLLSDPGLGLVLKPQFQRNAAARMSRLATRFDAARRTGRLLELSHGVHRNVVFPAEAALTADLAIGHVVGATASLEAALAGRRSLLLNPYGFTGANDALYARADIVYRTMDDALDAIDRHRRGEPGAVRLGDWSEILPAFDAFRDGRAAERTREFIQRLLDGGADGAPGVHSDAAYAVSS